MAATALASKTPAPHGNGVVTPAAPLGVAAIIPIEIAPGDYAVGTKREITPRVASTRAGGCRTVMCAGGLSKCFAWHGPNGT